MHSRYKITLPLLLSLSFNTFANGFETVTLGNKGGIQDGNLSAFLVKTEESSNYVLLDAGTIINGLIEADKKNAFMDVEQPEDSPYTKVGYVFRDRIKGYFISHAHLDHVAGMVIASPDDSQKTIYGLERTNKALMDNYFNWSTWPNFGNEGKGFKLNKYAYHNLTPSKWVAIKETNLEVMAMPLAHSGQQSTAFLLKNSNGEVFVYFGDTGADEVEKSDHLQRVWATLAPFVKNNKLKGIIIEVSFSNKTPDKFLFGHLTPNWLMKELAKLEDLGGGKGSLKDLKILISHIKYNLKKDEDPTQIIMDELDKANTLGVHFFFPEQGETHYFY